MNAEAELIKLQAKKEKDIENIIEGCMNLIAADTALSKRMDDISLRIDIVNKRLRNLEDKQRHPLQPFRGHRV